MAALRYLHPAAQYAVRVFPRASHTVPRLRQHGLQRWPGAAMCSQAHAVSLATQSSEQNPTHGGLRVRMDLHASQLIDEHREALRGVLTAVGQVPEAAPRDLRLLEAEISRLGDGFFMLVVAGEFNSGKSSLVNALIGKDVLPEGPTPTTARVTKLRFAQEPLPPFEDNNGVLVLSQPVPVLATRLQIVDTPGTNAIDRVHEALTKDFLPLCDVVLFVTSADRPFSESERLFLESIRRWGKKVVLIVNKIDLLESHEAKNEVMEFVASSARTMLGKESKVFAISARQAKEAAADQVQDAASLRTASGLQLLEDYINDTLDSVERLRLKLRSSASLGATIIEKYILVLEAHKAILDKDSETIKDIETLLQRHEESVRKGYPGHFARVDNVLLEVLDRAETFFETHVRVSNVWKLSNRTQMEQTFRDEVVKGTAKSVQREIRGIAEWLADLSSRNLTETTAIFSRRIGERTKEVDAIHRDEKFDADGSSLAFPSSVPGRDFEFAGGRERLLSKLSESSDEFSSDYVSEKEGKRFADKIASSVRLGASLGIGAVGALSTFLVNSSSLSPAIFLGDPTIPVIAAALGALGLVTVPRQRMALRAELKSRMVSTRSRLRNELRARLDEQLDAHVSGVRGAIEPFAEFSERELRELEKRTTAVKYALDNVRKLEDKLLAVETHGRSENHEKR